MLSMAASNPIRKPQQKRSIEKKEKILDAGYRLFDKKGYYKTSTPEIAEEAGVSIGCLYSYFKDKHEIFLEVYERYETMFDKMHEKLQESFFTEKPDPKKSFRDFICAMIEAHENSKGFQRELNVMYYSDPAVFEKLNLQNKKIQDTALKYMKQFEEFIKVEDLEAGAIVTSDLISSLVDRISFNKNSIDRDRIINEGVEAIVQYLYKAGQGRNCFEQ